MSREKYRLYTSGEIFYLKNVSDVINQFVISDPSFDYSFETPSSDGKSYYYDDYFTNDKTKYGVNVKGGVKLFVGPLFFEGYVGLGIAYRNNIHSNRENLDDAPLYDSFMNDNIQGEKIILNIPLNAKVGYRF